MEIRVSQFKMVVDRDCLQTRLSQWDMSWRSRLPVSVFMCVACLNDYFRCPVKGKCLPPTVVCDGHDDCGDGADERDCGQFMYTLVMFIRTVRSRTNTCVPKI